MYLAMCRRKTTNITSSRNDRSQGAKVSKRSSGLGISPIVALSSPFSKLVLRSQSTGSILSSNLDSGVSLLLAEYFTMGKVTSSHNGSLFRSGQAARIFNHLLRIQEPVPPPLVSVPTNSGNQFLLTFYYLSCCRSRFL